MLTGMDEDWWDTTEILEYLKSRGMEIKRPTWASYVSRGQAPWQGRKFGHTPVWRPAVIRFWADQRAKYLLTARKRHGQ